VTAEAHERAVRALIRGQVGDFPLDERRLRALCAQDATGREAVFAALAKPTWWLRLEPAFTTFTALLRDLQGQARDAVPELTAAAVLGTIRLDLPPQLSADQVAAILASAVDSAGPSGGVRAVLEAARAALRQAPMPLPDPLPNTVRRILTAHTALTDAQTAAATLTALMAQGDEDDQRTARIAILTA
jgi:hypothetical protein